MNKNILMILAGFLLSVAMNGQTPKHIGLEGGGSYLFPVYSLIERDFKDHLG